MSESADLPDRLDDLLERCLAARAEGQALGSCLADLDPVTRRELEPMVLLAEALRQAPRAGLSAAASAAQERRLLARGAELRAAYAPPADAAAMPMARPARFWNPLAYLTSWRVGLVPAATLFLLVASLLLVGGAGAKVSNARPDDAFYNLKLSWEQTQLLLSSNDAQRARVFVEIAQNRIREVELLAQDGRPIPEELLLQVELSINQAIQLSSGLNGREAVPLLRQISELLSYERMLLGRFLASLPEPDRATVELALQSIDQSQQSVNQTLQERVDKQVPGPTATIPLTPTATPVVTPTAAAVSPADGTASTMAFSAGARHLADDSVGTPPAADFDPEASVDSVDSVGEGTPDEGSPGTTAPVSGKTEAMLTGNDNSNDNSERARKPRARQGSDGSNADRAPTRAAGKPPPAATPAPPPTATSDTRDEDEPPGSDGSGGRDQDSEPGGVEEQPSATDRPESRGDGGSHSDDKSHGKPDDGPAGGSGRDGVGPSDKADSDGPDPNDTAKEPPGQNDDRSKDKPGKGDGDDRHGEGGGDKPGRDSDDKPGRDSGDKPGRDGGDKPGRDSDDKDDRKGGKDK